MKKPQFLQNVAYDYLIDAIKKRELVPGTIYSLNQMAQVIGISKTPLRDAVLRLEQERYIDILPSKGFVLHQMTAEDILETYQLREAIEYYCLKILMQHLDTPRAQFYLKKLTQKIELQKEIFATTRSNEAFARKDYEFHRSMVQYVDNKTMLDMYRSFMFRIFWLNVTSFSREGRMEDTIQEHSSILDKIRQNDLSGLEHDLENHLITAQDINLDLLEDTDKIL